MLENSHGFIDPEYRTPKKERSLHAQNKTFFQPKGPEILNSTPWTPTIWEFPKSRVPYFGALRTRILLFGVLY